MTQRHSLYVIAFQGVIVLSVILSATTLGVQGTLDATALTAIYSAAFGFAGGTAAALSALGAAVNGKAVIPTSELANREATLRTAFVATAAGDAHRVDAVQPIVAAEPEA